MARTAARICPRCGALNSRDEERCFRCASVLPGPVATELLRLSRSVLGEEYPVTKILVGACLAMYLFVAAEQGRPVLLGGSASVARAWGALSVVPGTIQPWRYLSASFVHYGIVHVGLNCWMLVSFGRTIEEHVRGYRTAVVFLGGSAIGFFASDLY